MELLREFDLNLTTLLFVNFFPFLFFGYHAKFWYNPKKIAQLDFFLVLVGGMLGLCIGAKVMEENKLGDWQSVQLALLHFAPLVLSVVLVAEGKKKPKVARAQGQGGGKPGAKEGAEFKSVAEKVENISWDDLVIDQGLKEELLSVVDLLKDPKTAKKYGIDVPKGILMAGPPGTGKTTIAKVMAKNAGLAFFALRFDEVVSKWVGESEKNLTALFNAANASKPAVIFIDEVDSIGKARGSGQSWADNLLNHLLQLVDGVVKQEGLYIIAATNRPDLVDDALKRPGRLDKVLFVALPDFDSRVRLFSQFLSKLRVSEEVDIQSLAYVTDGRSGADIKGICNQAGLNAYKRESVGGSKKRDYSVRYEDIEQALNEFLEQKAGKGRPRGA